MSADPSPEAPGDDRFVHAAVVLRDNIIEDRSVLAGLRSNPYVEVIDDRAPLMSQWRGIRPLPTERELAEPCRWAYYPWRRTLVLVLGPNAFRRVRLDRNRNKITSTEQHELGRLTIGVIGLSVGHSIAHTLVMEGLCGQLRLADFDSIELSNLNRIPCSVFDIGINKAVAAARRIAELDPYTRVDVYSAGVTEKTIGAFLDGLDLVIEECDSLDIKLGVRQEARIRGIPVLMETSDRGLFDVERFDLEPGRDLFHGLLGDLDAREFVGLSTDDKGPHVMRILQSLELSARMAASMVEIDRTITTWPQLGGDVQLGAATVAAAVRRFGLGGHLPSGRTRIDLDSCLDHLREPPRTDSPLGESGSSHVDLTRTMPSDPVEAVIHAIRLAPSGGNSQPWSISVSPSCVGIHLAAQRTSAMDVGFRGSHVAIGAAAFNARVAAAQHGVLGPPIIELPDGPGGDPVVAIPLARGTDADLAELYPAMIHRVTNRNIGRRAPLPAQLVQELRRAAETEGAELYLVTDPQALTLLGDVLAASDRLRYLTPLLHEQMMAELKWPGVDRLDQGIDVRTLGVDAAELAKLRVASRSDVMEYLAAWGGGTALGDGTRERVETSSALAVIAVNGDTARHYVHGGAAAARIWVRAAQCDLAVQPVSPVFLYTRNQHERSHLCPDFSDEITHLQDRFGQILGLAAGHALALVLRLSHDAAAAVRSQRLPRAAIVSTPEPSTLTPRPPRPGKTVGGVRRPLPAPGRWASGG